VWRFAEGAGVDIASAGQKEAVEVRRDLFQSAIVELGGEGNRDASGLLDSEEIGGVDVGPFGIFAEGDRGGDADEGHAGHNGTASTRLLKTIRSF
jgi:hypothetical protein